MNAYEMAALLVQQGISHEWHPVQSEIQGNRIVLVFSRADPTPNPTTPKPAV